MRTRNCIRVCRQLSHECYVFLCFIQWWKRASIRRTSLFINLHWLPLGLCDMDKKYISRFFDFFFDFDFNHDFDTNRHALSHILLVFAHLTCFCTSYLFLHILLVFAHLTCLAHLVLHFSLFYYTFYSLFFFFTYIYIYIYALVWCYFYIISILCTVH